MRPLKGHSYHSKTDAQLRYIIKDAAEAAQAMRNVNFLSECKYLDQVNDAATVLGWRKSIAESLGRGRHGHRGVFSRQCDQCRENGS